MTSTKPQFAIAELLKTAEIAQIAPATLPANANPWTLKDTNRAFALQAALQTIWLFQEFLDGSEKTLKN